MDEPLLGRIQRKSFSFQQNLSKLGLVQNAPEAENIPAQQPITPSELKEKLVYGSLETPYDYYISRLFNSSFYERQAETEDFLKQGGGRRAYNFHPDDDSDSEHQNVHDLEQDHEDEEDDEEQLRQHRLRCGDLERGQRMPSFRGLIVDDSGSSSESSLDRPVDGGRSESDWVRRQQKKCLKKSRTAPALNVNFTRKGGKDKKSSKLKRPKLESAASVVVQASFGLLIYLAIGMAIYVWRVDDFSGKSTLPMVDALYFCIVTMCTIGYGDITPVSPAAKLFACFFVLVGFGFIDILLSGMVAYVLERQEHLLLSAVEGSHHDTAKNYLVNTEKGRMRIRMKVGLALGVVFFCLAAGTLFMHWTEGLGWLDSFYLSTMSVTTVGYGDHTFKSFRGRLFAAGWLLVSTLAVARSFLFLAEARIDKRNRLIAKWVLNREMTVADLVAADIDNHGFVTKSEYVIYKLKEMGRIGEKEIEDVCKQFNCLDKDNSGRITISCLMNLESSPSVQ